MECFSRVSSVIMEHFDQTVTGYGYEGDMIKLACCDLSSIR